MSEPDSFCHCCAQELGAEDTLKDLLPLVDRLLFHLSPGNGLREEIAPVLERARRLVGG